MKKVLKFETVSCRHCKLVQPMLEGRAKNGEFELEIVDAEERPDLVEKYNVMSVPTVVVLEEGQDPKIATGVMQINKLLN